MEIHFGVHTCTYASFCYFCQLQAAKQSIHNIFHEIPASERMAYISHSRNLAKEREAKKVVKRVCTVHAYIYQMTSQV